MGEPVLSIVVPVYNAETLLDACLDALLGEIDVAFEVIAVDDGSRDRSTSMLATRAVSDPRLRIVVQQNRGPSAARNTGLAHAKGDYVWFVDADDLVVPGALGIIAAVAHQHDADIVSFNVDSFDGSESGAPGVGTDGDAVGGCSGGIATGTRPMYGKPKPATLVTGEAWVQWTTAQGEYLNYPWFQVIRRELLERHRIRFAENMLHEDIAFVTECLLHAQRVIHVDRTLYRYRRHAASLTGGIDDARVLRRIDSYFIVVEQLRAFAARTDIANATRTCLRRQVVAQGLQVDRLGRALTDPATRCRIRERCRVERYWQRLLADAPDWRCRRRVLKVLIAERLGWR